MAWLQPPQVVASAASCVPTAAGILPAALGPASVGLWAPCKLSLPFVGPVMPQRRWLPYGCVQGAAESLQ